MAPLESSNETLPLGFDAAAEHRVLLIGESRGLLTWATVLDRKEIRIKAARTGIEGRQALATQGHHVVIVLSPLPDSPIGAFVEGLLHAQFENLQGILVVVSDDEDPPTLPIGSQIKVHCCESGDSQGVEEAVVDILDLETRVAIRLEIQLEIEIGAGRTALPGLTHNVSEGGMLIETGAPLLPGVRSRVSIELPAPMSGSLEAEVEVVRHRRRRGERLSSVAVRFVDLPSEQAYRWKRFLNRHR